MIPDAAVEAAAAELYDREGYSTPLADAPTLRRERFRAEARDILEAAAPHMLREAQAVALEEAADAAFKDKKIQGLQRVLIGNYLRARANESRK